MKYALCSLVFILLAALDFTAIDVPAKMTFPLLWLSLAALWQRHWALAAALFSSFLGDVMGWKNELIPQIGFFALAQILYIIIYSLLSWHFWRWCMALQCSGYSLESVTKS